MFNNQKKIIKTVVDVRKYGQFSHDVYVNKFIRGHNLKEKVLTTVFFFKQIDTAVNNDFLRDIPDILDSTADQPDLSTINIDELQTLRGRATWQDNEDNKQYTTGRRCGADW